MRLTLVFIINIWLIGSCLRTYRQMRFFQIEEYMNLRYLRWLFSDRRRWLPARPVTAWVVGCAGAVLSEAPNSPLPFVILLIASGIAVWLPREREVKKPFRRTPRATRIIAAAFVLLVLLHIPAFVFAAPIAALLGDEFALILAATIGLVAFLLAPIAIVLANLLMTPVEAYFRRRFVQRARRVLDDVRPVVVGITGSYGKTSTKYYLAQVLDVRYRTLPTPKSYNTLMGVCIVINNTLADDYGIEYFIAEMGAYVRGEIQEISALVHPSIGIIVEVGPQHLERFGSLENIAIAKYELIKALPPDGVGVFNWDNPYVRDMYERGYPQTRLAVSRKLNPNNVPENGPRFIASDVTETLAGLRFTVTDAKSGESELFETPLYGEHTVTNLLLTTAVAVHEGVPLRDVARRVRTLQPAESRLVRNVTPNGITIINDAYSANPVGMLGSLRLLGMHTDGRRLLITPGMVELGELMEQENYKLGERAADHATDVILVGSQRTRPIHEGLMAAGFPLDRLLTVETLSEAKAWYEANLQPGDTVLFLNDLPDTY